MINVNFDTLTLGPTFKNVQISSTCGQPSIKLIRDAYNSMRVNFNKNTLALSYSHFDIINFEIRTENDTEKEKTMRTMRLLSTFCTTFLIQVAT